jgi:endonuclease-3
VPPTAEMTVQAEDPTERAAQACEVTRLLAKAHPDARCALDHDNAFQLLVATILSAQCTDERVNTVTGELFSRWPDAHLLAAAQSDELEALIRPTGFFRNKTRSLIGMAQRLVSHHRGDVPRTMDELVALRGVARKTANVVLGNAFGIPGLPVDTHVGRIARRLGLTAAQDPIKVEAELCALLPESEWTSFSHKMIFHGRRVCQARTPACDRCALRHLCDWPDQSC